MTSNSAPLQIPPTDTETLDEARRRFLAGALAGGAAGIVAAAGTGVVVWRVGDAELAAAHREAERELERLRGLVALYEKLEGVGLDAIIETALLALTAPLGVLEAGASGLRDGLETLESALLDIETTFPAIQQGIQWVEQRVSDLADLLQGVEAAIGQALDRASPITDALGDFVNFLLDRLPFGAGQRVRDALDRLSDLVGSVPELVEGINTHLLEPLRKDWFSVEEGEGIGGRLIEPLVAALLDPLEEHLTSLAGLLDAWEAKLAAPAHAAIQERNALREEIARYRRSQGFEARSSDGV